LEALYIPLNCRIRLYIVTHVASFNFPLFIARRIRQKQGQSFSSTVARIGVAGIALGLAAMLISFAIMGGYQEKIYQKIFSFGAHLQVSYFEMNDTFQENPIPTDSKLYKQYKRIPEIAHIQVYSLKAALLKTESEVQGIMLKGIGRDFNREAFLPNMAAGKLVTFADTTYSKDLVISRKLASQLNLKVNDDVFLYFVQNPPRVRKLTITGIYETGMEEFDESIALCDIALLQRLNNWNSNQVGGFEIRLKEFDQLEAGAEKVFNLMDFYMKVVPVTEQYIQIFDWLSLINQNVAIFLALILFVACFNMVAILLILIMERTQMIGLLKALGGRDQQVRRIFLLSGIRLVGEGMLWGNLVGLGLCALQYFFEIIPLDPEAYYINTVPIHWDFPLILLLNAGVFLLVTAILLIPTAIISRIQPVKALRFS
jgi:lipoprotein-releasing system permease protein